MTPIDKVLDRFLLLVEKDKPLHDAAVDLINSIAELNGERADWYKRRKG